MRGIGLYLIATLTLILAATVEGIEAQAQTITLFELGAGVRPLGMGGAFVALADDESATLYNPAGLAYLGAPQISSLYERRFEASNYLSALGALPRVGGGLSIFSFGPIEERNEQDQVTGTVGYLQVGLLGAGGLALGDLPLGAGGFRALSIGSRLGLVGISTAEGGSGMGFSLSWGLLLRIEELLSLPMEDFRIGLVLENAPGLGMVNPLRGVMGLAVRPVSLLWVALDVAFPLELHAGVELNVPFPEGAFPIPPEIAVRLGFFTQGDVFSFTTGLGLGIGSFRFDYAFISHPQLPGSHRLALVWRF